MGAVASFLQATASERHYRRREPTSTPLYRLVYHCHEQLERVWEERYHHEYGAYRNEVRDAFTAFLDCGVLAHGCARARCETCKHTELIAFSCKQRGLCSSCNAKRAVLFAEHLEQKVLQPVDHQHVVFTIPKRLRSYFRYDRDLHHILFAAAWGTLADAAPPNTTPGAILVVHTAGESLNYHPHLHGMVTAGGFDKQHQFHNATIEESKIKQPFFCKIRYERVS